MKALLCPTPQSIPVLPFGTMPHLIMGLPIGRSDTLVACTRSCGSGTSPCLALFSHVQSKTPSLFALVVALAACDLPQVRPGCRIVRRQVLGQFASALQHLQISLPVSCFSLRPCRRRGGEFAVINTSAAASAICVRD
eukprot:2552905-Pleurochrysis_carterae.AAC.1